MSDVATIIRQARSEAGLSQAALARLADTSQPALARYETGATLPALPTLERVLSACGRSLEIRAARRRRPAAATTSVRGQLGPRARELRRHRARLLDAAQTRGVRRVRVFGSIARGERDASDVDLLVELDEDRTLVDLAAFRRDAQEILGSRVDVATADLLKERVRAEAEAEALPL